MEKDFGYMSEQDWGAIGARFRLSLREQELLHQALTGRTVAEMARSHGMSSDAVQTGLNRLYRKCGAKDRVELAMRVTGAIAR